MTKNEILEAKRKELLESMTDIYAFLKEQYTYPGQVLKYEKNLTAAQCNLLEDEGWTVVLKDNGADKYGYRSWYEIS